MLPFVSYIEAIDAWVMAVGWWRFVRRGDFGARWVPL